MSYIDRMSEKERLNHLLQLTEKLHINYLVGNDDNPWFIGYKLSEAKEMPKRNFAMAYQQAVSKKRKVNGKAYLIKGQTLANFKARWEEQIKEPIPATTSQLWVCTWECALHYLVTSKSLVFGNHVVTHYLRSLVPPPSIPLMEQPFKMPLVESVFSSPTTSKYEQLGENIKVLEEQLSNLKTELQKAIELEATKPENVDKELNFLVRRYALNNDLEFREVWNHVYGEFKKEHRIDIKRIVAYHRPIITGVQWAKQHGILDKLYATAKRVLADSND